MPALDLIVGTGPSKDTGIQARTKINAGLSRINDIEPEVAGASTSYLWLSTYEPDRNGTDNQNELLYEAAVEASTDKKTLKIPPGTYRIGGEHFSIPNLAPLRVECDDGVIFLDEGRVLNRATTGTFRLPWGIMFDSCEDIDWTGGIFKTAGTGLTGSSTGTFNSANHELRKPVLGFIDCGRVRLRRIGHWGNPGQGISGTDRAAIVAALSLTPTANEWAYFAHRGSFFSAYRCRDIVREDCYLVADTCDREQVGFCDSDVVRWHRERSESEGSNFFSLGKIIGCRDVKHGGHLVKDQSTGSLVDMIGDDIHYYGANLDYPNGKAGDVSQEWGPANQPVRRTLIEKVYTNGRGVVNAGGTTEEMEAGPITDLVVRDCRFNIGETDFSTDLAPSFQACTDITSINDVFVNNFPFGRSWNAGGGTGTVKLVNAKLTWTKPAASVASARRQSISPGLIVYENCDWLQNASLAGASNGLASFTFGKDADVAEGRHLIVGGRYRDASYAIAAGTTVEFRGADLTNVAFTFADDTTGKVALIDCIRDGIPTGNWSAEAFTASTKFGTPAIRKEMDEFNAYICALKEIGAWGLIDSAGVLVTGKNDQYLVNLKTPYLYRPAAGGSPVWTRLAGVAGDGSSVWINLNFGPTTSGIKYLKDSAYIAVWTGGSNATSSAAVLSQTVAGNILLTPRTASDQVNIRINDGSTAAPANTDSRGDFAAWRTGASARNWGINGVTGAGDTQASTDFTAGNFTLFRRSSTYSAATAFLWMIGGGGLGAKNADLYYAKRYFLQARGAI